MNDPDDTSLASSRVREALNALFGDTTDYSSIADCCAKAADQLGDFLNRNDDLLKEDDVNALADISLLLGLIAHAAAGGNDIAGVKVKFTRTRPGAPLRDADEALARTKDMAARVVELEAGCGKREAAVAAVKEEFGVSRATVYAALDREGLTGNGGSRPAKSTK